MQKDNTEISVSYCRLEQASHLHFRVNPDQTVTVIVPEKTSDEEAQNYPQSQLFNRSRGNPVFFQTGNFQFKI